MNDPQDDDKPTPLWLRLCGTLIGAILTAIGSFVLLFVSAMFGVEAIRGLNVMAFVVVLGSVGGFLGFLLPRQTLNSLWIFLPGFPD